MPDGDLDLVKSMYSAFSTLAEGGDVEAYVAEHYHSDCEYQPVEESDVVRGHDDLVRWNQRWFDAWEVFRAEIEDLLEGDDGRVFAAVSVEGRGGESGVKISQRIFHVIDVRDGKIARMCEFAERDEAVKAAGLAE